MTKKPYSSQDIELLSAYLDHELDPADSTRLESRLQLENDLKDALQDMRRTRQVLRSLPVMRAPRNFTLTPAMIGAPKQERSRLRWFSTLRFSSALAGLLLVLVVLGDLLTGVTSLPSPVPVQVMSVPNESTREAAEPPVVPEAQLAQPPTTEPTPVGQLQMQVSPDTTNLPGTPKVGMSIQAVTPESSAAGEAGESADNQLSAATEAPAAPPFARGLGGGGGGGGGGGSEIFPGGQPTPAPFLTRAEVRGGVRTLEISLALIVIFTALAAWWVRRRAA